MFRHERGRWLFDESISYGDLARRVAGGAVIKTTTLSEEFTFESFREHYGDSAVPLFVVTANKRLTVVTADQPADPKPGDALISLVDGDANTTQGADS